MSNTHYEYDPATCITAGELRQLGIALPEGIPDCGWVPRAAIRSHVTGSQITPAGALEVDMTVRFDEPFRWVTVDVTIQNKPAAAGGAA